jgi:hypothetical protein
LTIVNDLISVEKYVKALFPTAATYKQTIPLVPVPNTFVVRFLTGSPESETAYHFRVDRDYQLIYFGATELDVLTKVGAVESALFQRKLIPIDGSLRYIRVENVASSAPFRTDNELFAAIIVLSTEVRQARDQAEYVKIANVNASINE